MRLGNRTRKGVLVAHIASAGAWLGMEAVLGVLVFTAMGTQNPQVAAVCYQALELFATWPLLTAGLLSLVTGVVLGMGTKYGLIRYWWVATKLALNLVLCVLVLILLWPGVHEVADFGRELEAGSTATRDTSDLMYPPLVSGVALLFAITLSLVKPWRRVR